MRNFRSHQRIVEMISEEFYDSELLAEADQKAADEWLAGMPPIQVLNVRGQEQMDPGEPSYFNLAEVARVSDLIESELAAHPGLQMKEIGVITPYRRQVGRIKKHLEEKIPGSSDIYVGSVENYQGAEKKVIIISTVRSNPPTLGEGRVGFLRNRNR